MIIISPSKKLNLNQENLLFKSTEPEYTNESKKISKKLRNLDSQSIRSLMGVSENIAKLNFERFRSIHKKSNLKKSAAFMFSGDTFNGLSLRSMGEDSLLFAQNNLRILSGLYGILKPFDNIEPHRLEMGTNTENLLGEDLYQFWSKNVTSYIKNDINRNGHKFLYNLASNEYSKVINFNSLSSKTINFDFKKLKDGNLVSIGMMIKKMRGSMAKFIIENKVENLDDLKDFKASGFKFSHLNDKDMQFVFTS